MQKTPLSVDVCPASEEGHPPALSAASGRTDSGLNGGYQQLVLVEVLLACCHSKPSLRSSAHPYPCWSFPQWLCWFSQKYCCSLNQIPELPQSQKDKMCFRGIFTVGWASL